MNILLAVDDDGPSYRAAKAVSRWFPDDAKVVALHVGPAKSAPVGVAAVPPLGAGELVGYPYQTALTMRSKTDEAADAEGLEIARRAARIAGGTARAESGSEVEVIGQVAREIEADLIVVGTGDRSWLSRLINSSVASEVVTEAPCSVLVVRNTDDR